MFTDGMKLIDAGIGALGPEEPLLDSLGNHLIRFRLMQRDIKLIGRAV
jgi:hypothetical protein